MATSDWQATSDIMGEPSPRGRTPACGGGPEREAPEFHTFAATSPSVDRGSSATAPGIPALRSSPRRIGSASASPPGREAGVARALDPRCAPSASAVGPDAVVV